MSGTLVLGGARSGKSAFAERLVGEAGGARVYLATGRAGDEEMRERIVHHQRQRGPDWQTIEEPLAIVDILRREARNGRAILVDCLTLWLSNLMMADGDVERESAALAACVSKLPGKVVFVSNEVGQGIVPMDKMARDFRDHAGRLHQMMAAVCDEVWFVTAGLPQKLK
jgi:adenosylcobinamide kinase/adenosylcobinamide-phosphate guanylyltransferase